MQAVRPVLRNLVTKNLVLGAPRAYHGGEHHAVQTVNDLPVPEGDWQEHHNAKNRKYNGVLAAGVVAFGVTLTLVINSGLIELQSKPPATYE